MSGPRKADSTPSGLAVSSLRFFSLSLVIGGSPTCNARCPFCIASMTPLARSGADFVPADQTALAQVAAFARAAGADQVMLTGKGEPTLWPDEISACLETLAPFGFGHTDMQTNGVLIAEGRRVGPAHLDRWWAAGLGLVAISIVSTQAERNREIYLPYRASYPDLGALVARLHDHGFAVRLAAVMLKGYIDSGPKFAQLIADAQKLGVEQLTARPVTRSANPRTDAVSAYVESHALSLAQRVEIAAVLGGQSPVADLPGNGRVYDVGDLSVCLADSMTTDDPSLEVGRQLIYYPDGTVSASWEEPGVPLEELIR
jgi:pyruvate-formate lyase-activating enzyme